MLLCPGVPLTERQVNTIVRALECAGAEYQKHASTMKAQGAVRVADQFTLQARECDTLAELIETH